MLYWFIQHFVSVGTRVEQHTAGDSRVFLTARIALSAVTAFLAALIFGPRAIDWLGRRFRERVASASSRLNELHRQKNSTPTMGGIFIVAAIVIAGLLWADLTNHFVQLGLIVTAGFAVIGGWDDWVKLSTGRNGLTPRQKFVVQVGVALVVITGLWWHMKDIPRGLSLVWPIGDGGVWLGAGFILWGVLVLVGASNGVNLTDGLDGLASGCLIFSCAAYVALCYLAGNWVMADYLKIPFISGSGEMGVLVGAMVGAVMGFLWFNCYPAQVFMGDTGSLPLGALLGLAALVTKQELLLLIVGGVFVVETISVIVQIGTYKLTGRRLIECSPLHNHFLIRGQSEQKIVVRFWIGSAVLAIMAMASLKIH